MGVRAVGEAEAMQQSNSRGSDGGSWQLSSLASLVTAGLAAIGILALVTPWGDVLPLLEQGSTTMISHPAFWIFSAVVFLVVLINQYRTRGELKELAEKIDD